jgi:hypothetical protein
MLLHTVECQRRGSAVNGSTCTSPTRERTERCLNGSQRRDTRVPNKIEFDQIDASSSAQNLRGRRLQDMTTFTPTLRSFGVSQFEMTEEL